MDSGHHPGGDEEGRRAAGSAALLVVLLAVSVQIGSALAVNVISSVGVVGAAWLRTAFAALILLAGVLALRRRALRLPPRGERLAFVGLVLALLGMNLSFYGAISRAPVGIVVAIEFLGPLAVAVMGMRRRVDWVWIGLAGAGVALLAGPTSSVSGLGVALALFAGACWAAYLIFAKRAVTGLDPLTVTLLMTAGSALLLTPLLLVSGMHIAGHRSAILLGIVVAVLSSALPFLLELIALRRVRAATYGVLLSIEPALAALAGFVVLGQRLNALEIVAIGAVMAAAAGASWTSGPAGPGVDVPMP
jgi:inner membrane transporter RhtA